PAALALTTSSTPASCTPDGSVSVSVSGGTANYTYAWAPGGATAATVTGIAAGLYTVNVTDANGCTASASQSVGSLSLLNVTASVSSPILCNGQTATVAVTATGGNAPYSGTGSFANVAAGNVTYTVTDANGCTASTTLNVTEPAALSITLNTTAVTCAGANNGTAVGFVTGGTGAYSYLWSNALTTNSVTNLTPGNITLTVTDANGCTSNASGLVNQPAPITATVQITNITCNGLSDGIIDVTVAGGTPGYSFIWDDPVSSTSEDINNLAQGTYSLIITDANGCTASISATVNEPAALALTTSSTPASCTPDGSVSVSVSGGTANYTYAWAPGGATAATVTGIAAGLYTVNVTDANGCTASASQSVGSLSLLNVTASVSSPILCNGQTATVAVTATGGNAPYSGTGSFANVAAGNVTYTVTDANGCTASTTLNVTEPAALSITLNTTAVTCAGANNGTAVGFVTGGTGAYSYLWSNALTTNSVTNLTPGNITLTVTDANGCTSNASGLVNQPAPITATVQITNITCNGLSDGIIDVTVAGGTPGYSFIWDDPVSSTSEDINNLAQGTYSLIITDANGCTSSISATVNQPNSLSISSSITSPILVNGGTGIILVSAVGGTPPYSGTGSFTETAGTYTYNVTDANGCTGSTTITITAPNALQASVTIISPILCNGGSGTVNVSATGGIGPYSGTGSYTVNAGPYSYTVTDAIGVTASVNITITEPAVLTASGNSTNVLCNGLNNGSASVSPTGGTAPYTYLWSNGSITASTNNLVAGGYTVTVTDANGCTTSANVTITEPTLLTATTTSTNVSCNGLNNGSATVSPSGGTAPYTYLWSSGTTTSSVSNLAPGNYSTTVTDANGCTAVSTVSITEPLPLIATASSVNVTCNGLNNGSANVSPSGGTAPYTYLWSTGATTPGVSNLAPANYSTTVTDANGCTTSANVTITEPTLLTATTTSTNVSCNGLNNGSATVSPSGGTAPYTYLWSSGTTTSSVSNLAPGNYSTTVTDANGCTAVSTVSITEPLPLIATASSVNATCNGLNNGSANVSPSGGTAPYTYLWSTGATIANVNNLSPGNYSVIVADLNGCSVQAVLTIFQPALLSTITNFTNVTCNGFSNGTATITINGGTAPYLFAWNNGATTASITNLAAGNYSVTVTDANGCVVTDNVTITQPSSILATVNSVNITCNGLNNGSANVTQTGGIAPYTYQWSTGGLTSSITNLGPGNYSVSVTDINGCSVSANAVVTEPPLLLATLTTTNILCNGQSNGSATVSQTGGTAPFTYLWSSGAITASINNLGPGNYSVIVTDANGCSSSANATISQPTSVVANSSITQNILCNGGTGQIDVIASGGILPYSGIGTNNVVAGTYTYTVTDANGCTGSTTTTITEPTAITLNIIGNNPLCNGSNNGLATAIVGGGTAPYTYSWTNGSTTNQAVGLSSGSYSVIVTDANGCQINGNVILNQPGTLSANSTVTSPIICFGGSGQVSVSANGGTLPYTGTGVFSVVTGNNSYTVTDANGCTASTSINVPQPTQVIASAAIASPIPCFGGNGNIIVTASGGTPNYSGIGSFSVPVGTYSYTVTDANGCTNTTALTINQPSALTPTANVTTAIPCFGGSGTVTVGAIGGTPGYNGTGNFTTVAGLQSYTVTDLNGCSASVTINVAQPSILASSITSQNVSCFGLNNGAATVTASGGTAAYSYLWSGGNTTATASNLTPGTYSVTVTDANGCQSVSNVVITQPTLLTSSSTQTSNVLCFGGTANVFVAANGGTAPYSGTGTFSVVAGNTFFTVSDANGCTSTSSILITQPTQLVASASQVSPILCFGGQALIAVTGNGGTPSYTGTGSFNSFSGNNTYTIQDANGCTATSTINITQPSAVTATFNNSNVTCFGFTNGASTATVTGGTPGYTYLWSTGSTTNVISAQPAGTYSLQVTDNNGCIFNFNTTITQPALLVSTANIILPIACFGGQAIVLVNGSGGTPGYSGNGTFFELAGTYTYTLTDQNGCSGSTTITVPQPAPFIATATITNPIPCNGGQATVVVTGTGGTGPYTGTGVFNVTAGNYTYTIIDVNGCTATTTITVTQPAVLNATATILNSILCNGGTAIVQVAATGGTQPYSGIGTFSVIAGNYTYLVSDVNGCNTSVGINVPQPAQLVTVLSSTNITCFGANNGSAAVVNSGGTAPISTLWSNGSTSNSISNLSPGNYNVTVTDFNGCQNINSFVITQPNALVASAAVLSPVVCFNGNATVSVSATGGTNPYNGTGNFFPTSGTYAYVVTDANGCSDTANITVTQPTQLITAATIISPVPCFGGQAQVSIVASGGISPYSGIGTFNVNAGNQSFTVSDANGCSNTINLFISQPNLLSSVITVQNVTCLNAGNGIISITPSGGTPAYQYLWSNGATSATVNNLSPGNYSVVVTDSNGCQTTNQATITQPNQLQATSILSNPVFCFGGTATVNVSASGGTAPYNGTGSFQQAAGTLTYYVTDANGCLDSATITVTQPPQLAASVVQTSNVQCFGGTATVNVSATGGTPIYNGTGTITVPSGWNTLNVTDNYGCLDTVSIFIAQPTLLVANSTIVSSVLCNGGNAVIDITATGGTPSYGGIGNFTVSAGTYTYTVSDANGCTSNTTITVNQPAILQAIATITTPIGCNGGTGTVTISGIGGTAPYNGTGSFNVPAGTYTYPLVDANGCQTSVTITINQPPVLSLSLTQININCNGFATGSIIANPAGGQAPYTYLWSNGQITQSLNNLIAGTYTVTVTDNVGCTVNGSVTVTQPAAPLLLQETHVNVLCFGNNSASINLTVSGGTAPYSYQWSNGATTQDINNLIAGTYNVTVTDANGCNAVISVNITQPALPLSVSYTVNNISCFGLSDGSIDVTPSGGTGPFTYFWTSGQNTQDLNNIPPGTYIVAITDANNCVAAAQIVVTQPAASLTGTISQIPINCFGINDGQLTANAFGGTAPYSYLWSPTGQTGNVASLLGPGTYAVTITDANGCTAVANDVLTAPQALIASFTVSDNVVCLPSSVTFTNSSIGTFSSVLWTFSNGDTYSSNQFTLNLSSLGCVDVTLLINGSNGCTSDTTINDAVCVVPGPSAAFTTSTPGIDFVTGELEFINNSQNYIGSIWQFGDGGSSTQDNPIHNYPSSTVDSYNVVLVVYDANGCTDTAAGIVESNDVVRLTVPNAFTPNGDGLNDLFTPIISNVTQVKYFRFEVYNRWGQIVFESNKVGDGWDGKYKGKPVQFGTYTWKVSYNVEDQGTMNASGHVTSIK
ncbi:MAG: gliding motility-associated C-terminal domain-containing protein, partial [Bacteroidetes bacterium]|nr:gliding motility-associated C-terminal domain-containing protein [Bacteroidota bacterium]